MSRNTLVDSSRTEVEENVQGRRSPVASVTLKLRKPKPDKKVQWTEATVDNEHLNRKKSKCCCVYVKPKLMGESSTESEDECEHCTGHVEVKKEKSKKKSRPHESDEDSEASDRG
ncbi:E3 ubiquitin-protein ligase PPP1R11 [Halotydeus destructor]|nr:E3 ubiquitin-protein ligase PPP1R11 [Halotydeus destructor]